jgi:hypothetical protein
MPSPRAIPPRTLGTGPNYLAQGKKTMARKDLERILAEDAAHEGIREHGTSASRPRERGYESSGRNRRRNSLILVCGLNSTTARTTPKRIWS